MTKPVTLTLKLALQVSPLPGQTPEVAATRLTELLTEFFTSKDGEFYLDFGTTEEAMKRWLENPNEGPPGGWHDYEGPFYTNITVEHETNPTTPTHPNPGVLNLSVHLHVSPRPGQTPEAGADELAEELAKYLTDWGGPLFLNHGVTAEQAKYTLERIKAKERPLCRCGCIGPCYTHLTIWRQNTPEAEPTFLAETKPD